MIRLSSHRLPFSLSIGAAPIPPPPIGIRDLFDIYYYDRDGALGTIAGGLILLFVWQSATGSTIGGNIQDSPEQTSPIGSVIGGDIQDDPEQTSPIGTVAGGTVQPSPNQSSPAGSITGGTVQPSPNQSSPTGTISGGTVLPPETLL